MRRGDTGQVGRKDDGGGRENKGGESVREGGVKGGCDKRCDREKTNIHIHFFFLIRSVYSKKHSSLDDLKGAFLASSIIHFRLCFYELLILWTTLR